MVGTTIGRYRIVEALGSGAAGVVYRAVDETLGRDVAIKVLNPNLAGTELMKRFRAEATILARLNHPQIATIYDLYRSDSDLLMVMELVRGETLESVSRRCAPLPPDSAASLVSQILSALEHAHRAGVVHRDMKPANVMVTSAGTVKIMDFGIARMRGAEQMTLDGRLMGTPAYMPPEQVLGEEVDGRADLYAVGVVLYCLLAGALPFDAETPVAMLQQQVAEPPVPIRQRRPDLPEWCDPIVERALAKTPADRFQTPAEFREALNRVAATIAPADLARQLGIEERVLPAASAAREIAATLVAPREPSPDTHTPQAMDLVVAVIAILLSVVGAGVAYFGLRPDHVLATPAPQAVASSVPRRSGPVPRPEAPAPEKPEKKGMPGKKAPAKPAEEPRRLARASEGAPLIFRTKALVGSKGRQRERDAHLALADGTITVTADDPTHRTLYEVPYESVLSISYSRGRDPLWNSPNGPAPVTRAGGTLGRLGIYVEREWISLRTTTTHQFVSLRFDEVLVPRVLLALEERTGRTPQLVVAPEEGR